MAIKYYQAAQLGAPTCRGQAGSLIALLDACLVDGYGSVAVVSITRSGSTATVTTGTAHGLSSGDSAVIAGAGQADYNGEFIITKISATVFTITVANTPATPATGTITSKRAGAGFSKVFSGTNKAVYRSNDTSGLRHYIRVLDDGTTTGAGKEAAIRGYVTMSDVDTGTEPFPTVAQAANGLYAYKSSTADAVSRAWKLITDGKTFYFGACVDQAPTSLMESGGWIWWTTFGEVIPTRPGDAYCSFITGVDGTNRPLVTNQGGLFLPANQSFSLTSLSVAMPRDWNNTVGAVWSYCIGHGWAESSAGALALFAYPHPQDNGFYMTPWLMTQRGVMRGRFPGVFEPLQGRCLGCYDIVENVDGYPGRKFIALWGTHATTTGMLMFDMTGDSNGKWS